MRILLSGGWSIDVGDDGAVKEISRPQAPSCIPWHPKTLRVDRIEHARRTKDDITGEWHTWDACMDLDTYVELQNKGKEPKRCRVVIVDGEGCEKYWAPRGMKTPNIESIH